MVTRCAFLPSTAEMQPALGWGIRELLKEGKDASTGGVQLKRSPWGLELAPCHRGWSLCSSAPSALAFQIPFVNRGKVNPRIALSLSAIIENRKPVLGMSRRMSCGGCSAFLSDLSILEFRALVLLSPHLTGTFSFSQQLFFTRASTEPTLSQTSPFPQFINMGGNRQRALKPPSTPTA